MDEDRKKVVLIGVAVVAIVGAAAAFVLLAPKTVDPNAPPKLEKPLEPTPASDAKKPQGNQELKIEDPKRNMPSGGPRVNPDYKPEGK